MANSRSAPRPLVNFSGNGQFDSADYELLWPRELFARELAALRTGVDSARQQDRIAFLLEEAFLGETPVHSFRTAVGDPGDPCPAHKLYLDGLTAYVPRLREHHQSRPYWPARHGRPRDEAAASIQHRFAELVNSLRDRGYLQQALPKRCVDERSAAHVDPSAILAERLGIPHLWPLSPYGWDRDTFFGLVEVFHDLVARPRERKLADDGCGWHYTAFTTETGRTLYRWKINQLFESAGIELRLAEDGEDLGRLVRVVDDGRAELIERVLTAPQPNVTERVTHAIALFRARNATEEHKRSAIVTLANVLEERRELLKKSLFRKDEGALFQLANEFDLRHRNDKQHTDYDPAFRDWIFWWYLATVELTDRLLARQAAQTSTAMP